MSDVEWVIQRFDKVRKAGKDAWTAVCPAHNDKSPSLSIKDTPEKILIHCHAGCDPVVIMGNVGLEMADLFHTQRVHHTTEKAAQAEIDELILLIAREDRAAGKRISEQDKKTEAEAFMRTIKRGKNGAY